MQFQAERKKQDTTPEVVRPRGTCGVQGCDGKTSINLVVAMDTNGRKFVDAPSVYMDGWKMRSGYTHCGWIERCCYCYSLERQKKSWSTGSPIPMWTRGPFADVRSRGDFVEFFGGFIPEIARRVVR